VVPSWPRGHPAGPPDDHCRRTDEETFDVTPLSLSPQQRARLRGLTSAESVVPGRALNITLEIPTVPAVEDVVRALSACVHTHPALRMALVDGRQHERRSTPVDVHVEDLGSSDDEACRSDVFERAEQFCRQGFAPAATPRLRALLLRGTRWCVLAVALDPLVCDAWSANLISAELTSALDAAVAGETSAQDARSHAAHDPYRQVWQERHGTPGEPAASSSANQRLVGVSGEWVLPGATDRGAPMTTAAPAQALRDLPDDVAAALQERCRQARTSVLAPALVALQILQPDPLLPRAVVSTLACRETDDDWATVGHLATDVWVPVSLRGLTVAEAVRSVRDDFLDVLGQVPHYWRESADQLDGGLSGGGTVSVLYLPAQLSGGGDTAASPTPVRGVTRAAVSICPTGADLDLFLVEHPPVDGQGRRPALRLGGELHRGGSHEGLARFLDAWADVLTRLAGDEPWEALGWPALADAARRGLPAASPPT
jgi:hypothetical protein